MSNKENENLKGEDDSPSAAAGSEAQWEQEPSTISEDIETGKRMLLIPSKTGPQTGLSRKTMKEFIEEEL